MKPDKRKPTPRSVPPEPAAYSRANWRPQRRRASRRPRARLAGALAAVAVVAAAGALVALVAVPLVSGPAPDAGAPHSIDPQQAGQPRQTAVDASAERIVMTVLGDRDTYVKRGELYIESGCHAVDRKEGELTDRVVTSGEVDADAIGDYTVTYSVTNAKGATKTATRTVHVTDEGPWNTKGISVLMYHYVYTDDDAPDKPDANYLHADKLAKQCAWLQKQRYYYPSYRELAAWLAGEHSLPAKSVVLTFDDGQAGFFKHGIPVLERYQVPATSFLIGNRQSAPKARYKYASDYVSFQSHSHGLHEGGTSGKGRGGIIYDLSEKQLVADAEKMREFLGSYEAFAYPYGDVADAAPAALRKAGVLCAFTIVYGQVKPGDDPMRLNRVRVFKDSSLAAFKAQVKRGAQ